MVLCIRSTYNQGSYHKQQETGDWETGGSVVLSEQALRTSRAGAWGCTLARVHQACMSQQMTSLFSLPIDTF